jgi:protein-disulfide isomerase
MTSYSKFIRTPSGKILVLTALLFISLLGYYFYALSKGEIKNENPAQVVTVSQEDHTRGGKNASVTIVEYADFQCPACKAYEVGVRALSAKYPEDVRVTYRYFPLIQIHKNAFLAASYAEAAGAQGKFWEMHDALYDNQGEWGEALDAEQKILSYAKTLGLDLSRLQTAAKSQAVTDVIAASYKEAGLLKLQGTPSFFVNGNKVESMSLQAEVDKAVAASKK